MNYSQKIKYIFLRFLFICGWVILITCLYLLYVFSIEASYKWSIETEEKLLVFAHRGFGNHAPDNSIEGARIALEEWMDGVDVDAQYTKDREVVIFHDVDINRFTQGTGRVDSYTFKELQQYDLSIAYGDPDFQDVFIASFEDFVSEITPDSRLMVELKVSALWNTGIEEKVSAVIEKYDAYDKVFISAFNPFVLKRLESIDARIQTVFIYMNSGWDPKRIAETKPEDRVSLPWFLRKEFTRRAIRRWIRPDALSINHKIPKEDIQVLMDIWYPVFIWSLNTPEVILEAIEIGPYWLVTDEPQMTKDLRDTHLYEVTQ